MIPFFPVRFIPLRFISLNLIFSAPIARIFRIFVKTLQWVHDQLVSKFLVSEKYSSTSYWRSKVFNMIDREPAVVLLKKSVESDQ